MPRLDGYEVTRAIREHAESAGVPVILVLSARVAARDVDLAFRAGADGYIKKPFSPGELSDRVEAAAERTRCFA